MINITLIILFAIILSCKAVIDTLLFHYSISPFKKYNPQFWDPDISWKNKYKLDTRDNLIPIRKKPWYYFGLYKPYYREKFPYSTTLLVSTTDALHLFITIRLFCYFLIFTIVTDFDIWLDFLIFSILHSVFFEFLFTYFYKRKK